MKTVKRNFIIGEENIRLNKINDFQVIRYFDPNHFELENTLNLHFDYLEGVGAEYIRIVARYIDTSKSMELYEPLECFEEFKIPFLLEGISKKNKLTVSLNLKEDNKFLWKIGIQIIPRLETLVHLSIS